MLSDDYLEQIELVFEDYQGTQIMDIDDYVILLGIEFVEKTETGEHPTMDIGRAMHM
jgi:hypothetical protein